MTAAAQSARQVRGAPAIVPVANEPPARIVVDQPDADSLAIGRVVIQYYAENVHIVPVYGKPALEVSPRVGHVHVTVDDASWHWLDASGEPIVMNGFAPGPHKVRIQLVDATHIPLDEGVVTFTVPPR